METSRALVVGVENYHRVTKVAYARADAIAVAKALRALGADVEEVLDPTSAGLGVACKQFLARAGSEKRYIFFAGHGISDGYHSYLCGVDLDTSDAPATSFRVGTLLAYGQSSSSKRLVVFLDACHTGLVNPGDMRGAAAPPDAQELGKFFTVFASSRIDQKSYGVRTLGHGAWTHHLVRALTGAEPGLLRDGKLHVMELQQYLHSAVQRTLDKERNDKAVQTPVTFGSFETDPVIADLNAVLAAQRAAPLQDTRKLKDVVLEETTSSEVSLLEGFKKGVHRVPTSLNNKTRSFVEGLAAPVAEEHVRQLFPKLRAALGLKTAQMKLSGGGILTPSFDYAFWGELDETDPSLVTWRREIRHIRDASALMSKEVSAVLEGDFDTVTFETSSPKEIDLEVLVGELEEFGIDVDYTPGDEYVAFWLDGLTVNVSEGGVSLTLSSARSPKVLIEKVQKVLPQLPKLPAFSSRILSG